MRGLHWPNTLFQPVDQGEIVGISSEEGLAQVNVRLHKAGQENAATAVDDLSRSALLVAQSGDPLVLDQHIALEYGVLRVERYDSGAFNEQSSIHNRANKHSGIERGLSGSAGSTRINFLKTLNSLIRENASNPSEQNAN